MKKEFPMLDFAEVRHLRSAVAQEFALQYIVERQMNMDKMLDCIANETGAPEKNGGDDLLHELCSGPSGKRQGYRIFAVKH